MPRDTSRSEAGPDRKRPAGSDTWIRIVSAAVLAPVAIGAVIIGGWPFVVFWSAAAIGVYWEWTSEILHAPRSPQIMGAVVLAAAGLLFVAEHPGASVVVLALGCVALALLIRQLRSWCTAGLAYAGVVLAGPALLRPDPHYGILALVFLFAVVWATDVLAYFGGRLIGGAKLAPRISPGKTWSGAVSGTLGGIAAGTAVAFAASLPDRAAIAVLATVLAVIAQIGDLFESSLKRRFGIKDSSRIIPGHGGLMDRLDGFLAAAGAAALLGVARGGFSDAARGLLVW